MKANTDHFKQFLVYCSARGLVYCFDPQLPRMQVIFQGSYVNFEIPTTVEEFDYLTSKEFPEKLGVSPCRFAPDTLIDQYKVYAKRQSIRVFGADLSKPFRYKSNSDEFDFSA